MSAFENSKFEELVRTLPPEHVVALPLDPTHKVALLSLLQTGHLLCMLSTLILQFYAFINLVEKARFKYFSCEEILGS